MAVKDCKCCGAPVDIENGGCAIMIAFCRQHTTTLTNVAFCAECFENLVREDLTKLNANAGLQIAIGDEA